MNKQDIFKGFNNHFVEFIEDIHSIFPNDKDITMTRDSLLLLKKSNPKIIIDQSLINLNSEPRCSQ